MMGLMNIPASLGGYSYSIMKLGPLHFTRKGLSVASTAACLTFTVSCIWKDTKRFYISITCSHRSAEWTRYLFFEYQNNHLLLLTTFFIFMKGLSKCKPLPDNHNPWTTSICLAVVYAPLDIYWCSSGWNCSHPYVVIKIRQFSVWWGRLCSNFLCWIKFKLSKTFSFFFSIFFIWLMII